LLGISKEPKKVKIQNNDEYELVPVDYDLIHQLKQPMMMELFK
jgi:hypothetical protein